MPKQNRDFLRENVVRPKFYGHENEAKRIKKREQILQLKKTIEENQEEWEKEDDQEKKDRLKARIDEDDEKLVRLLREKATIEDEGRKHAWGIMGKPADTFDATSKSIQTEIKKFQRKLVDDAVKQQDEEFGNAQGQQAAATTLDEDTLPHKFEKTDGDKSLKVEGSKATVDLGITSAVSMSKNDIEISKDKVEISKNAVATATKGVETATINLIISLVNNGASYQDAVNMLKDGQGLKLPSIVTEEDSTKSGNTNMEASLGDEQESTNSVHANVGVSLGSEGSLMSEEDDDYGGGGNVFETDDSLVLEVPSPAKEVFDNSKVTVSATSLGQREGKRKAAEISLPAAANLTVNGRVGNRGSDASAEDRASDRSTEGRGNQAGLQSQAVVQNQVIAPTQANVQNQVRGHFPPCEDTSFERVVQEGHKACTVMQMNLKPKDMSFFEWLRK